MEDELHFISSDNARFAAGFEARPGFIHKLSGLASGTINISEVDQTGKLRLGCIQGERTLADWLLDGETKIWSERCDKWDQNHSMNNLATSFKLRRLTVEAAAVLQSIITATIEFHEKGLFHGHLNNTKCFLLRRYECRGDVFYSCRLVHQTDGTNSFRDMSDLHQLINYHFFHPISPSDLPADIQQLNCLLSDYGAESWNPAKNRILKNHISLWPSKHKAKYWTSFADRFKSVEFNTPDYHNLLALMQLVPANFRAGNWKDEVPSQTPLESVLCDPRAYYGLENIDMFRYIRNKFAHIHDWNDYGKPQAKRRHPQYGTNDYLDKDFIEALPCEIFCSCMIPIFEVLVMHNILI